MIWKAMGFWSQVSGFRVRGYGILLVLILVLVRVLDHPRSLAA